MILLLLACAGGDDDRATYDQGPLDGGVPVTALAGVRLRGEEGERSGEQVGFADLTGDGQADAVVGPVLREHGGGTWPALAVSDAPFAGDLDLVYGRTVGVAGATALTLRLLDDLDLDGHPDLVMQGLATTDERHSTALYVLPGPLDAESWWEADGAGPDGGIRVTVAESEGWLAQCPVATGDLSRDGLPDLLTCGRYYTAGAGSDTQGAAVLLEGPFVGPEAPAEPRTVFGAPDDESGFGAGLVVADLYGGGLDAPVIVATGTPGDPDGPPALYLYEAPPEGLVEADAADGRVLVDADAGALTGEIAAGDLDGDGYADLVVLADPTGDDPLGVWIVRGPPAVASVVEGVRAAEVSLVVDTTPARLCLPGDINVDEAPEILVGTADDGTGGPGGGVVHVLYGPFPAVDTALVYGDGAERVRDDAVAVHATRLGASLAAADVTFDGLPELLFGAPGWSNDYEEVRPGAFLISGGVW